MAIEDHLAGSSPTVLPREPDKIVDSDLGLVQQQSGTAPHLDPFDTTDPRWTLENHLGAYVQRSKESSITSVGSTHASLLWQDVSVYGEGTFATYQGTVSGLFMGPVMAIAGLFKSKKGGRGEHAERTIIQGFDGIVKDWEMLLLIGRHSSGCTTLLKTLAGLTDDYKRWQGTIEFSGVPVDAIRKRFRGDVVYNPESEWFNSNLRHSSHTEILING